MHPHGGFPGPPQEGTSEHGYQKRNSQAPGWPPLSMTSYEPSHVPYQHGESPPVQPPAPAHHPGYAAYPSPNSVPGPPAPGQSYREWAGPSNWVPPPGGPPGPVPQAPPPGPPPGPPPVPMIGATRSMSGPPGPPPRPPPLLSPPQKEPQTQAPVEPPASDARGDKRKVEEGVDEALPFTKHVASSSGPSEPKKIKLQLSSDIGVLGKVKPKNPLGHDSEEEGEVTSDRASRALAEADKLLSAGSGLGVSQSNGSSSASELGYKGYFDKDAKFERAKKLPLSSKKVASSITKWTHRQGELHAAIDEQLAAQAQEATSKEASEPSNPPKSQGAKEQENADESSVPGKEYDFTIRDGMVACLLCNRSFKKVETLDRHVAESDLHKGELEKEQSRKEGFERKMQKLQAMNPNESKPAGPGRGFKPIGDADSKYRDRASERRAVFGADNSASGGAEGSGKKPADGPKPPVVTEPSRDLAKEGIDTETNKGAKLLEMMGWKKDQGLGASGEGRTAPIATVLYGERAGLGSGKARDPTQEAALAGKSWAEALKERARSELGSK